MEFLPPGARAIQDQAQSDRDTIADMIGQGIDVTQPMPVRIAIGFPSLAAAREAAVELLRAGYQGVAAGSGGIPNIEVITSMVLTAESLASLRQNLDTFSRSRGGMGFLSDQIAGDPTPAAQKWPGVFLPAGVHPPGEDQQEQDMLDQLYAWDLDLKARMDISFGLGFATEAVARQAASDLFSTGWPEVRVVNCAQAWVVEVVISMVPSIPELKRNRLALSAFANSRSGGWMGFSADASPPKQVLEES